MVEDETHFVSMTVDAKNASAKSRDEIVHRGKQDIGQHGAFEMSPETFDQVQARTIRRQPEDFDAVPVHFEPAPYRLGLMEPGIVADQTHLPSGIGRDQDAQEQQKVLSAFGLG